MPSQSMELASCSGPQMKKRYFSSEEDVQLVSRDVQQLQDLSSLYASEYLLKGSEEPTGLNANYLSYRAT
jgi:hypothetical protein